MTEPAAQIILAEIGQLDAEYAERRAALVARLRVLIVSPEPAGNAPVKGQRPDLGPDLGMKDLITAAEAADIAKRAKPTMGAWCRKHAIDAVDCDRGFAVQIGGRWFVSKSRLLAFLSSGSSD